MKPIITRVNKGGRVFLAASMANDRGRRGGRAGAKSGKAGGRGRGSNQANPNPPPGREEDGGEGGRGGGTGGTRGGRGQARRGGRGGKRVAGSDAAAGTSPASKARKTSHPNKKAKPGGEPKVLWSPGKAGGGGEAGTGSSIYRGAGAGGGGTGGNNLVTQNKLSSLASSFNERYGEVVGFDEEETEGRSRGETGAKAPQTTRRKRSLSGGGGAAIAEEAARSMSPSKLAAEMQKARARAREERFGAGSAVNRPSSLARRTPPVGSISAQALPSAQAPVGNANGRAVHDASRSVNRIPLTPSPPPEASAPSAGSPLPGNTAGVTAVTTASASASASASGAVAGATRVAGANGFHRASLASPTAASGELPSVAPTPPTSAASALPIVTPLDIEEDEPSAARGSGRFVTVVDELSPVETTANMSPSKRPAPDSGDVVVIEPPAKKAGTSSPSAAAAAAAAETQGDAAKVHTLRLRLRTDLSGGEQTRFGGVEKSKSFEPPNSPVDGGVEECKGFDPPNLPRTQQQRQPTPLPSSTVSPPTVDLSAQEKLPRPPLASTVSSPAVAVGPPAPPPSPAPPSPAAGTSPAILRSKSAEEVAPGVALSRESSWGPSFGIATATEPAAAAAAATALPKPVTGSVKNPWVLSPEAPTFAKNQGRPLARSFSQPTTDTDTAVTVSSGAGTDGNRGLGRDHGIATGPGVVRPVVGSSGGGGGRGEGGASGHDRRPTSRPAATSRLVPPPSPAFPAATAAPAAAAATRSGAAANRGGGAAAAPSPAAAPTASVCVSSGNEPSALRVTQDVLPSAESSIRSSGGQGGVSRREATCTEGERGVAAVAEGGSAPDAQPEESVLGLRVGGRAGELLERLRREREESLDFERKLTQALLDL